MHCFTTPDDHDNGASKPDLYISVFKRSMILASSSSP